jgi:hypothetical protein
METLELRSPPENYGEGRQPHCFRANGSYECTPDDSRRTPSDFGPEWVAVRVKKTRQTARFYSTASAMLKHTINAAVLSDMTARARSACFSISESIFIDAERPVSFQRRREHKHRPTPGLALRLYFSPACRASACPQRRHSKVCFAPGFEVAIMYIPHFGHDGRRGSFDMCAG